MPEKTFNQIANMRREVRKSLVADAARTATTTTEGAQRGANIRKTVGEIGSAFAAQPPNLRGLTPEQAGTRAP
jgi:hypothetical protein